MLLFTMVYPICQSIELVRYRVSVVVKPEYIQILVNGFQVDT